MYEHSEHIKTGRVDTVVFNLNQIKQRSFFGTLDMEQSQNLESLTNI